MIISLLDLEHYSDRHRPELAAQPTLKRKELHEPFFPPDVFEGYFNPKRRRRAFGHFLNYHKLTESCSGEARSGEEGQY